MMRLAEKSLLLRLLDQQWKDHLLSLDHLRQGINLRAYGQRDPLNEYKGEAFEMFQDMLSRLRESVTGVLCHLQIGDTTEEKLVSDIFEPESDQEMVKGPQTRPAAARPDRWYFVDTRVTSQIKYSHYLQELMCVHDISTILY